MDEHLLDGLVGWEMDWDALEDCTWETVGACDDVDVTFVCDVKLTCNRMDVETILGTEEG